MKLKLIIPALAIAAGLLFTGCKEGEGHDHDHDHDHGSESEHAKGGDGGEHAKGEAKEGEGHDKDAKGHKDGEEGKGHDQDGDGEKKDGEKTAAALPAGVKAYPLETCIVAGSKLGSMGEPHVIVHEGQQVKFCCDGCLPKFEADPKKYLTKLTPAAK
ncbi:MAG: hypothetical protein CMO80_01290 [Verrucomicrobiales bacterium]|nr:hypothetical protein [Verrucomicrobiales bacterium]|tara:strand:+ start:343 stop:816 length:474 start_codon:yes stop_codon:yes gene_type:complete